MTRTAATQLRPVPQPNAEFAIEKGVPMPVPHGGKYPFAEMKVGDSFYDPCQGGTSPISRQNSIGVAARQWAKRQQNGAKFTIHREGDGVRIWRTA